MRRAVLDAALAVLVLTLLAARVQAAANDSTLAPEPEPEPEEEVPAILTRPLGAWTGWVQWITFAVCMTLACVFGHVIHVRKERRGQELAGLDSPTRGNSPTTPLSRPTPSPTPLPDR